MSEKIQVAVLACGARSKHVVKNLLRDSGGNVNIAAVYDPDPNAVSHVLEYWEMPDAKRAASFPWGAW